MWEDARTKIVVTDAVAGVVGAKSSIVETEGGTKQVKKVVKDAHEVVAMHFHAVHRGMCTMITQR